MPVFIVRKVVLRSHPMECLHASRKSDTYYPDSKKKHRYDLRLRLLRVLREARKNMPLLCRSRGCGQGTSKWVGLT